MTTLEQRITEVLGGRVLDRWHRTFPSRAWAQVDKTDTCWNWQGSMTMDGYGLMQFNRRSYRMHRAMYQIANGPMPDDQVIDHLCRNRKCVNPDHLEPVTITENVLRGIGPTAVNRRKVRCKNGHAFDDANTYISPEGGRRACRTCRARAQGAYKQRLNSRTNQPLQEQR